jgi:hypothetical protein
VLSPMPLLVPVIATTLSVMFDVSIFYSSLCVSGARELLAKTGQRCSKNLASFCREMQFSTEKSGFVRFFLLRFLVDMYVCLMAHI